MMAFVGFSSLFSNEKLSIFILIFLYSSKNIKYEFNYQNCQEKNNN